MIVPTCVKRGHWKERRMKKIIAWMIFGPAFAAGLLLFSPIILVFAVVELMSWASREVGF